MKKPKNQNEPYKGISGASLIYLTMDSSDQAREFSKKLFSKALIAEADMFNKEWHREFIEAGAINDVNSRVQLQLVTPDKNVNQVLNLANKDIQIPYPALDTQVIPIASGDKSYLQWIQTQTKKDK